MMIWIMLALLLGMMLVGIPILLCIAFVGFVGIAAEPGIVLPLFARRPSRSSTPIRCSRCRSSFWPACSCRPAA